MNINTKSIKALKPPNKNPKIHYDNSVPGFGVQITAKGVISFVLNYCIFKIERRITIGRFPEWSPSAAREKAVNLRLDISKGNDPLELRQSANDAPTFKDLADRYYKEYSLKYKRPSSLTQEILLLKNWILPAIGKRKIFSLKLTDIEKLHTKMKDVPIAANRAHALLGATFRQAIRWGVMDKNPADGLKRYQEPKRDRYLSDDERARLIQALHDFPTFKTLSGQYKVNAEKMQSCTVLLLLMLTGCRKGEALQAHWTQFDLKAGTWTKKSAHTKQKLDHTTSLSSYALDLVNKIKALDHDSIYLFPGKAPDTHQTDLKKTWKAICKQAGLDDFRIHDIRHSFASTLVNEGESLSIIGEILGHTQAITTARYAHIYHDTKRAAAEKVGAIVEHARTGKTGEVVLINGVRDSAK